MLRYLFPALLLLPSAAFAQKNASVPDSDPEVERKSFIVAPGFEVNLFAADPLLAKPIQMNWDPQGRLWVASSALYPQIKPGEKADDKIVVLEDTDGDGKADKTTVFADGLLIPTGIEPGDGGAYVANSTELVHLSATVPGGKADRKRIVLSGFGTEDTHHILHTFRWGPDQSLYFNQSVYIHSHLETPSGVKHLNGGGIWRFKPDGNELDVFVRGFWNPWGHAFDRYGQSLVTDGANGEGITHGIPGASYPAAVGATRILHGLNPGSPKHCGLEVMSGRHLPDDWQGDVLTHDFRGHRVCRFKLSDDGSTFSSREMPELIKTNHPAFRPVDVKVGPDGAIYVADWYNPIIQHGEVDFRDPRRDHTHGRIWRIAAKGRPPVKRPDLVGANTPALLDRLRDPEDWTRQQARRVLKERGAKEVLPQLAKWLHDLSRDDRYEALCLEALWVWKSLGLGDTKEGDETTRVAFHRVSTVPGSSPDPHVRAAFVRLLPELPWEAERGFDKLRAACSDESPRVRLEAVRGLAQVRTAEAALAAAGVLKKPMDRTLDYALWLTLRELEPYWMPEFRAGRMDFDGDAQKLGFALNAVGTADAVKPVAALLESGKVAPENRHGLWLLLARTGGADELQKVLAIAADAKAGTDGQRGELAAAVEEAVRQRKVDRPTKLDALPSLLASTNRPAARAAARLIGLWKVEAHRGALEATASAEGPAEDRAAAMEGLALLKDAKAKAFLAGLCEPGHGSATRRLAVVALAGIDAAAAAGQVAAVLAAADPADPLADVFAAFLSRKGGATVLAASIKGQSLAPDVAKVGLRAVRASLQDAPALTAALTRAGGLGAQQREPTPDEVKALAAFALKAGDPARGEAVFRRADLKCLACHGVGGAGGQVGPDLTGIGASAPADYLVESIRIPNKAVKEGFHAFRVVTLDGKVHLGVKVRETKAELVLRTPEDKEETIPANAIDEKTNARSLMPDGIADALTAQEFADLVRFMSELGKVGPYAPSKARVLRRWQAIDPTAENMALLRRTRAAATAEADNPFAWTAAYSRVSGELPLAELPQFGVWKGVDPLTVVRCQIDATTGGPVALRLNSAAGVSLYVGPVPVAAQERTVLDLKAGVQTLTFLIDRTKRTDDLRCELEDVAGSPARAGAVGGK